MRSTERKTPVYVLLGLAVLLQLTSGSALAWFAEYAIYEHLSWSPDGNRLAFGDTRFSEGMESPLSQDVVIADVATGELTRLTARVKSFTLLSNGERILINRHLISDFARPVALKDLLRLPFRKAGSILAISESPGNDKLAYLRCSTYGEFCELGIIDSDGTNGIVLADDVRIPWRRGDEELVPSPDGKTIAFIEHDEYHSYPWTEIWVMNADGTGKRLLVERKTNF